MIELKRLKLINWHNFENVTFDCARLTYMIGVNAVGKTTILDAIRYCLTTNRNFNALGNKKSGRTLQGASAFFITQRIEVAVGGQAVANGVQNGGLAHGVHADHIGQAGAVEGDIFKIVPVDKLQPFEFDHSSPSPASSGRS